MRALSGKKLLLIVLVLGIVLMGSGFGYALTAHVLPGTGLDTYHRNFGLWTVTNQSQFNAGVLNNVDVNTSPGDVKIVASSSNWLAGYSYRKSIAIAHSDGAYANTGGTITTDELYTVHTFTSNGTFTSCKAGTVSVQAWGGGGGGGYLSGTGGGGGGGGAYAATPNVAVTSGTGYTIVVGRGGTRDNTAAATNSTFATTTVRADRGLGSSDNVGALGGLVANCIGTTKSAGGAGKNANTTSDSGGGGGGAGGPDGAGINGTAAAASVGGAGGRGDNNLGGLGGTVPGGSGGADAARGGGGGAGNSADAGTGGNGGFPGGGGGGTDSTSGAAGAAGQVIVRCLTSDFLSGGAQTNYQMQLTVSNSSGVSSGSTVYLNGSSLNWPYDIRFTNSSGTNLLDYWIESNTSTTATVWVEFDAIPAHPDDGLFYMYWGKASDTGASNGANTFPVEDNFGTGTNEETWIVTSGTWANVAGGYIGNCYYESSGTSSGKSSRVDQSFARGFYCRVRLMFDTDVNNGGTLYISYNASKYIQFQIFPATGVGQISYYNENAVESKATVTINALTWYLLEVYIDQCGNVKVYIDGTLYITSTTGLSSFINFELSTWTTTVKFDDVLVRNYVSPEPTWGAWGTRETEEAVYPVAWYNASWSKRAPVTISNAGSALTDYQVLVNVTYDADMQADFDDIRFASSDGIMLLPYWCESYNASTAFFWVNVSSISAGSSSIYMYYGNSSMSTTSNFSQTFTKDYNDSGLVALWHMDEGSGITTADSSGNGNTGNLIGGLSWNGSDGGQWDGRSEVSFSTGNCLNFDGSQTKYVNVSDSSSLSFTNAITIEAWVKPTFAAWNATNDWAMVYIDWDDPGGSNNSVHFSLYNGKVSLYISSTGADAANLDGNTSLTLNQSYHIAATFDSGTFNVYLNGSKDALQKVDGTVTSIFNSPYTKTIGVKNNAAHEKPFKGPIDEVRIYNRALSQAEIQRHYIRSKYANPGPTTSMGTEISYSISTIASDVCNTGHAGAGWDLLGWSNSSVSGTSITFEVRASNTSFLKGDSTPAWQPYSVIPTINGTYHQWRATLNTFNGSVTPLLNEVRDLYSW